MRGTPHPWRELRALSHLVVRFRELRPGRWGESAGHLIWLDRHLGQVERRCTLAHELEHVRRGDLGCQPEAVEARVRHAAARFLLPDSRDVADALVWARGDLEEAADHLWVDEPTLRARLDERLLDCAEAAFIGGRVAAERDPA